MILELEDKPRDVFDVPLDLPPAYEDIGPSSSRAVVPSGSSARVDVQARPSFLRTRGNKPLPAPTRSASPTCNVAQSTQKLHRPSPAIISTVAKRDKVLPSAPLPVTPKTQNDVRETIRGLVRDVVQGSSSVRSSASAALGVLESCAEACSRHSVSFARILQERRIENHSPIYWAIVSRPALRDAPSKVDIREDDAFLVELIAHAAPLTPISMSELRIACLVASNNWLFQRFLSIPGVIPLSGTDRMLLSSTNAHTPDDRDHSELEKISMRQKSKELPGFNDIAEVKEGRGRDFDSFSVGIQLKMFQRRMRVSGEVKVEFIVRGRLWQLIFFVVPSSSSSSPSPSPSTKSGKIQSEPSKARIPGAVLAAAKSRGLPPGIWALALALLEGSTQCYAEARVVVADPTHDRNAALPGHPRSATLPPLVSASNSATNSPPPLPPRHISAGSETKPSKLSFFRRIASEDKNNRTKSRPPIVLNITSTGCSPLIALPSPALTAPIDDELDELSPDGPKPKRRRPTREEKRAARKAARKEKRAREGRETKKDKKERARLAETVLIVGLEEASPSGSNGLVKGGELMYDGCPYILPDGTLRAVLETRLSTSPPRSQDSDCVIC